MQARRWRGAPKRGLAAGALIVLSAAHVYYWYWPRQRAAVPEAGGVCESILASDALAYRVWIPYPHQNLALVEGLRGEGAAEAGTLLGVPRLRVPTFGPFPVPPARELVAGSRADGSGLVLAARIYPAMAILARLAGRLAANPWLSGGELESGGRRLEVRWKGNTWVVSEAGGPDPAGAPSAGMASALRSKRGSLALIALASAAGPMPAGVYALRRSGADLELASIDAPERGPARAAAAVPPVPLLVAARTGGDRPDANALLLVAAGDGALGGLPASTVFHRGPGRRWELPVEGLLALLGREPTVLHSDGWEIVGSSAEAAGVGLDSLSTLAALVDGDGGALRLGVWIDLESSAPLLLGLADKLEQLPLAETRRWSEAARLAARLGSFRRLDLTVEGTPPIVRITLLARRSRTNG